MSESKGLQGDLDQAFRDYFEFNGGSSHYFHAHTHVPDPRVNIDIPGLKLEGPISLPLSASVAVEMGKATVRDKKHWDSIFDGGVSGYWRRDRGGSEAEESEDDSEDESEDEPKNEREDEEEAGGIPPNPVAISPYKVKLGQAWGQFLDKRVMDRVWTALGAPPIDLNSISSHYKLANATAHLPGPITSDSTVFGGLGAPLKRNEMAFATVCVILPSVYEGGQLLLAEGEGSGSPPIVLDTSEDPLHTTYVLAWYNSATPALQPITSGCRFALTYDLIHTRKAPKPRFPIEENTRLTFRAIFQKWRDGGYGTDEMPAVPLMAYVIPRTECEEPLLGVDGLTGKAANIVERLLPILKASGFAVCVAHLKKTFHGLPHKKHWAYGALPPEMRAPDWFGEHYPPYKSYEDRNRYWSTHWETPPIGDILSEETKIENVTRIDGAGGFNLRSFEGRTLILPTGSFEDSEPDESTFSKETYQVRHVYNRSALVFYRLVDEPDIIFSVKGPYWFLTEAINVPQSSSLLESAVITAAFERLESVTGMVPQYSGEPSKGDAALALLYHASQSGQAELWNRALLHCNTAPPDGIKKSLELALQVFGFDELKDSLFALVKGTKLLGRCFELIHIIQNSHRDAEKLGPSLEDLAQEVFDSCEDLSAEDLSGLEFVAKLRGSNVIPGFLAKIKREGCYRNMLSLTKALHELRVHPSTAAFDSAAKSALDSAFNHCLTCATSQWKEGLYFPKPPQDSEDAPEIRHIDLDERNRAERVCELVKLYYTVGDLRPYVDLLNSILTIPGPNRFKVAAVRQIHEPLISPLKATLTELGVAHTAEPFISFFRNMVGIYFHGLGRRIKDPRPPPTSFACHSGTECAYQCCFELRQFLRSEAAEIKFKMIKAQRMHLEKTIAQVPELATYLQKPVTLNEGNPHTLVIRRSSHVMAAFARRNARSFAKLFWNRLFGSDEEAREMMGDTRYQNALNALSARRAYDVSDVTIAYAVLEATMEAPTPAAAPVVPQPPVPAESSARGTKRKHT